MVLLQHDERNDRENKKHKDNNSDEEGDKDVQALWGEVADVFVSGFDAEFLMRAGSI